MGFKHVVPHRVTGVLHAKCKKLERALNVHSRLKCQPYCNRLKPLGRNVLHYIFQLNLCDLLRTPLLFITDVALSLCLITVIVITYSGGLLFNLQK